MNADAGLRLWTFVSTFPYQMPIEKWVGYTRWYFGVFPIFGKDADHE